MRSEFNTNSVRAHSYSSALFVKVVTRDSKGITHYPIKRERMKKHVDAIFNLNDFF
jgi:hypothetical protein